MKTELEEKVAISIVTYEALDYVKKCIKSLSWAFNRSDVLISIIDNSESNDVFEYLKGLNQSNILIHRSDKNLGFGKAHNLSFKKNIKEWGADFILLANPDLVIEESAVRDLRDHYKSLEKDQRVGIVGPQLINDQKEIEYSVINDTNVYKLGMSMLSQLLGKKTKERELPTSTSEVFGLSGAIMLFRESLIEEVGLFDKDFFMYHEDNDFSARLNSSGRKNFYIPEVTFVHSLNRSSGDSRRALNWRKEMMMKSYLTYFRKHKGLIQTLLLKLTWSIGLVLRIIIGRDRKWAREMLPQILKFDYKYEWVYLNL